MTCYSQIELCNMVIECCSQERSYSNFYGLIGERFCKLNRIWTDNFQEAFQKYYDTIHRYETNKLRNIGRFFGHLLASDAISWAVLHVVHMNEDETTSSSRIFVKIFMQEMMEEMGMGKLVERFKIPDLRPAFAGMFPMDNPKNTRFAINYFTSIGLGKVTEDMRRYLQNAPKLLAAQHAAMKAAESSEEDSDTDSDSSELSSSGDSGTESEISSPPRRRRRGDSDTPPSNRGDSDSPPPKRRFSHQSPRRRSPPRRRDDTPPPRRREPPPRRSRDNSPPPRRASPPPRRRFSGSRSPPRKRYDSDSRSPPPRRRVDADSRSPPPKRRVNGGSRSPPPRRRYDDSRSPPARRAVRDDDTPPRRR